MFGCLLFFFWSEFGNNELIRIIYWWCKQSVVKQNRGLVRLVCQMLYILSTCLLYKTCIGHKTCRNYTDFLLCTDRPMHTHLHKPFPCLSRSAIGLSLDSTSALQKQYFLEARCDVWHLTQNGGTECEAGSRNRAREIRWRGTLYYVALMCYLWLVFSYFFRCLSYILYLSIFFTILVNKRVH